MTDGEECHTKLWIRIVAAFGLGRDGVEEAWLLLLSGLADRLAHQGCRCEIPTRSARGGAYGVADNSSTGVLSKATLPSVIHS